jgi:hypothetical protein
VRNLQDLLSQSSWEQITPSGTRTRPRKVYAAKKPVRPQPTGIGASVRIPPQRIGNRGSDGSPAKRVADQLEPRQSRMGGRPSKQLIKSVRHKARPVLVAVELRNERNEVFMLRVGPSG